MSEDLTNETFVRALRAISGFRWRVRDLGDDVGAWLVTIARNLLADHIKAGLTRLEHPTDDP